MDRMTNSVVGASQSETFDEAYRKVKNQVRVDLTSSATMLQRLLLAVDLFPLGV